MSSEVARLYRVEEQEHFDHVPFEVIHLIINRHTGLQGIEGWSAGISNTETAACSSGLQ